MTYGSKPQKTEMIDKAIEVIMFMGQSDLAELELTAGEFKMKLKRYSGAQTPVAESNVPMQQAVMPIKAPEKPNEDAQYAGCTRVVSPITGTFYAAPSPNADPFVKVGSVVKEGSLLCYIEAMKLMNEIKASVSGRVVKILAKDAEPVAKGTVIMLIGE